MKGWYFAEESRKLRYNDERDIVIGETHTVEGPLELCKRGLHASKLIFDALHYAPGPIVYRVELSGDIEYGDNKMCATERTYLEGGINVSEELQQFARECALRVVHLWDAPQNVIDYLQTGDEKLKIDAALASVVYVNIYAATYAALAARAAASAVSDVTLATLKTALAARAAMSSVGDAARAVHVDAAEYSWQGIRLEEIITERLRNERVPPL